MTMIVVPLQQQTNNNHRMNARRNLDGPAFFLLLGHPSFFFHFARTAPLLMTNGAGAELLTHRGDKNAHQQTRPDRHRIYPSVPRWAITNATNTFGQRKFGLSSSMPELSREPGSVE